jgi:hypothetical protein
LQLVRGTAESLAEPRVYRFESLAREVSKVI